MLEKVRKPGKAKSIYKVIGWGSMGVICIAFMFMGLTPDTGGSFTGGGAAAIVNDTSIPIRSFREAVERETQQIGSAYNNLPAAQRRSFEKSIRERTLNSLVATEVLFQSARDHGFFVPDLAVRDELAGLPYFQEDGRFSRERYLAILNQNRLNPAEFESQIRRQVTIGGVRDGFTRALKKPGQMKSLEAEAGDVKLNVEFIRFAKENIDMSALTTDAALKNYVNANKDEIKSYYQDNKTEFEIEKEVRARHILIKSDGQDDSDKKALSKIEELRKELTKDNFADMAKKHSEDVGSKPKGGDLGFFGKGRMVPEFEKVAMSAKVGEISEPVKTNFGYHLILVDEVKGGGHRSLEESSLDIAKSIIEKEGRKEAMASLEKAVESGEDLQATLKKFKLKWEETGEFSLNEASAPKLGGAEEVITEALRLKVGQVSQKLVRSEGQAHIVRLKKLSLPKEAKSQKTTQAFSASAMESLNRWAEELRENARVQVNTMVLDI